MPETIAPESAATVAPKGLLARAIGILTAPRATYAQVVARPRWLGILALSVLVTGGAASVFLSTQVGRRAVVDQQISQAEAFGRRPTQAQLDMYEKMAPYYAYFTPVFQLVGFGLGGLIIAGLAFAVFNALLGGDASFKQVFAVVAHSTAVLMIQPFLVLPLNYVRETMSSPTNLAVFLPMLDEASFVARFLGAIDLFLVWWTVNLAIGLAVLYKRQTKSIATGLLLVYVVIALVVAAVKSALSGA